MKKQMLLWAVVSTMVAPCAFGESRLGQMKTSETPVESHKCELWEQFKKGSKRIRSNRTNPAPEANTSDAVVGG